MPEDDKIEDYDIENGLEDSGSRTESKTSQLDDELIEKLENAFHKQTSQIFLHEIARIALEHDPIDLAFAVSRLPASTRYVVYENLPDINAKTIFMINTGSNTRTAIFREIDDTEVKEILEHTPPDEAVWMLDDMSDRRMQRILKLLSPKKAARILELQKHDRHSAGRLMTNEFFAFPMEAKIGEVSTAIRNNPGIELTKRIFVLNQTGELIGYVPDRNIIINPPFLPLRQVMRPVIHKVTPETSRDEVVDLVERYKIPALPVVNQKEFLVGVINYEDVVETMEDIADQTINSIGGTAEDFSENEPIGRRFLWRAPWLLVTLCAGLINAAVMSHFRGRFWFTVVPFFVPLVAGMSGNVGIQCSTILVRGLARGELPAGLRSEATAKEMAIGLVIGTFFGFLSGAVVFSLSTFGLFNFDADPFAVSMVVGSGLFGACIVATMLGTFSPFVFARFRIDPAVAAGPIVTAFNDLLSTLVYLFIAWAVSSLFYLGL